MKLKLKRVYEEPLYSDGRRILVDRLWPRGLSKDKAGIDVWLKEVAPTHELREWFGHDEAKWAEFQKRYKAELESNPEAVKRLQDELQRGTVTLVFGAKDELRNNAVALKAYLGTLG